MLVNRGDDRILNMKGFAVLVVILKIDRFLFKVKTSNYFDYIAEYIADYFALS